MKHAKVQNSVDSSSHSARPFFSKRGEGSSLTSLEGTEQPFFGPTVHQTKLEIGQPNDQFEREADRVADQIVENQHSSSSENGAAANASNSATDSSLIQRTPEISSSTPLTIQKQASRPAVSTSLGEEYIELICEVIDDIQGGVAEGRTWHFEREVLLQGDEEFNAQSPTPNLIQQRQESLQQIVSSLHQLAESIRSGTIVPSEDATRRNLGSLWLDQGYDLNSTSAWSRDVPQNEIPPDRRRGSDGELIAWTYSPAWYIGSSPGSPHRMLQPANITPWWEATVSSCENGTSPDSSSEGVENTPVLASSLGDVVIYLTGANRDQWDWEPRDAEHDPALGRLYNWQQDERSRVYIMLDNQQNYLLQDGRLTTTAPEISEAEDGRENSW